MLAPHAQDRWEAEFRVRLPDGTVRWMHGFGQAERDAEGWVTCVRGLNFDVTAAHRTRGQLRESEARLRLATEVAGLGMIDVDYATGLAVPDERAAAMFGLAPGVAVAREAVQERFRPEDRAEIALRIREALDPQGEGGFAIERRIRRPNGSEAWLQLRKQVSFDGPAEARRPRRGLWVALDVTERKLKEDHSRFVAQEMAHRSKNLLALVQAVARQTAGTSEGEFLPRFEARLRALAASQDLLVTGDSEGVELAALARRQLAHFGDILDQRIRLDGPPVQLNAGAAQMLGLVLHELSTNAGKHGALSTPRGAVHIDWSVEKGDLTLSWREAGGPPVRPPLRTGFGTVVMDRMMRRALDAEVRLAFASEGFSWHLRCPLERVG
jgi:PAS domain S-box-containing protein